MTGTRVVGAAVHRVRLPLRVPHVAAHGTEAVRELLLVGVTDGAGTFGWGECPTLSRPGYADEHTDGAWEELTSRLVPGLVERGEAPGRAAPPMAAGAVRDAVLDLGLRRSGESWSPRPAGDDRPASVPFGVAIGLDDDEEAVVRAAHDAAAAGAAMVVLKVRPGWSVAPLAAVRRALPDLAVAVDANGSFDPAGDLDELRALDALGPSLVEQPVVAGDLGGSARVAAALEAPVSLDESLAGIYPADAIRIGAASVATLKPSRCGGLAPAVELADRFAGAGWGVHVGGMLESGLGRAVARLLATHPAVTGPAMVGPTSLLFPDDVVDPVEADGDGRVPVPTGPGLAPPPDPDRLGRLTVARAAMGRWP